MSITNSTIFLQDASGQYLPTGASIVVLWADGLPSVSIENKQALVDAIREKETQ